VDGFLNLNKPAGFTSHDCVAKVRRILRTKKVGHGGTLDPAAVGVLPIAIGKATRLLQYLPGGKAYRAIIRFGVKTTTDDLAGEVIYTQPVTDLSLPQIQQIIPQFIGKIQQIPPIYSAIQIDGQRLYKLARAGETVEVPAREVEIHAIEVLQWTPGDFPELEVQINCGGGTYIRSIARDLGVSLGTQGVLAFLERNASCGFQLQDSITLEELTQQQEAGIFSPISPTIGLSHLPAIVLSDPDVIKRWSQGQKLCLEQTDLSGYIRVLDDHDRCLGIGEVSPTAEIKLLVPQTVLL
jgi:tRNA pseudouridine55 synthase